MEPTPRYRPLLLTLLTAGCLLTGRAQNAAPADDNSPPTGEAVQLPTFAVT